MKAILFFLIFLLLRGTFVSQVNIHEYLPLKIGNSWVYSSGNSQVKFKITSTVIANSHLYYVFEQNGTFCTCAQGPFPPFLISQTGPFRIDSTTGNLYQLSNSTCSWMINETLIDTLKIKVGNIVNNSCYFKSCIDTNLQNIFGSMRKTKYMGENIMTYFSLRRYAYGIGLVSSNKGCFYSSCSYNLLGCVIDGTVYGDTSFLVGLNPISSEIPDKFVLSQNYPNPFNPVTKIKFDIPAVGQRHAFDTKLTVFDAIGREVQTLVNEQLQPGTYEVEWNAGNFPSGVYYYKLESESYKETKKMVLIK